MKCKNKTMIRWAALGACLLLATPASSEENAYARSGAYLGANVVGGHFPRVDRLDANVSADEGVGFNAYAGYRLNPGIAIELQYEMLPKVDLDIDGGGNAGSFDMMTVSANGKVFLWPGRFQPFTLVGFGVMRSALDDDSGNSMSGTESTFAFRFGAGLDFYITRAIAISTGANYMLPAGSDLDDFDYVSYGIGALYRF